MAMKSASSPRRLYVRGGHPLVLMGGLYFGPAKGKNAKTVIDPKGEVTLKMLETRVGARKRAEVSQLASDGTTVTETWLEQSLTFVPRVVPSTEGTPSS